jgi:hypothetical protein
VVSAVGPKAEADPRGDKRAVAAGGVPPGYRVPGTQRFLVRYLTVARQLATGDLLPQDCRELGIDRLRRSKVEP